MMDTTTEKRKCENCGRMVARLNYCPRCRMILCNQCFTSQPDHDDFDRRMEAKRASRSQPPMTQEEADDLPF